MIVVDESMLTLNTEKYLDIASREEVTVVSNDDSMILCQENKYAELKRYNK